jgi:transposase
VEEVVATQLVEGGVDASVCEHFIFRMLEYVRNNRLYDGRPVVLLMDNASIHHQQMVIDTVLGMKVFLVFNPQYSPHLNPVEMLFKSLKSELSKVAIPSR